MQMELQRRNRSKSSLPAVVTLCVMTARCVRVGGPGAAPSLSRPGARRADTHRRSAPSSSSSSIITISCSSLVVLLGLLSSVVVSQSVPPNSAGGCPSAHPISLYNAASVQRCFPACFNVFTNSYTNQALINGQCYVANYNGVCQGGMFAVMTPPPQNNYGCQCDQSLGYGGYNCDQPICVQGCAHGGRCVAPNTCSCPLSAGWGGSDCTTPICQCKNGGLCIGPGQCRCQNGYSGPTCEVPSLCDRNPCINGGSCVAANVCSCVNGFTGSYCQLPTIVLTPNCTLPCLNGAVCSYGNVCVCVNGYTGSQCQTAPVVGCTPLCQNGGVCSNGKCYCPTGYSGNYCQTAPTCQSGTAANGCDLGHVCVNGQCISAFATSVQGSCAYPCQHGGVCIGSNTCLCSSGYDGRWCEIALWDNANVTQCSGPMTCDNSTATGTCTYPNCSPCTPNTCYRGTCQLTAYTNGNSNSAYCSCIHGYIGWNGGTQCAIPPVCSPSCNHGRCIDVNVCTCNDGWSGTACDIPPNQALSTIVCTVPCQNGGICGGTDMCICPPGTTGPQCQNVNPVCDPLCENGGSCVGTEPCSGSPICICFNGFSGNTCQNPPVPICASPCLNGGVCTANNVCLCPSGYSGNQCQIVIPPPPPPSCTASPCLNGGTCVGNNICSCIGGFNGVQCENAPPVCSPSCQNGGLCISYGFGAVACKCINGYSGDSCQLPPSCPSPCQNGGSCAGINICTCQYGYSGSLCQIQPPLPVCSTPCRNGGICTENNYCTCTNGYSGSLCEIAPSPPVNCACSTSCLNGGQCLRGNCVCILGYSGTSCETPPVCPPGYTGSHCSQRISLSAQSSSSSGGAIAGAVIGSLVGVAAIVGIITVWRRPTLLNSLYSLVWKHNENPKTVNKAAKNVSTNYTPDIVQSPQSALTASVDLGLPIVSDSAVASSPLPSPSNSTSNIVHFNPLFVGAAHPIAAETQSLSLSVNPNASSETV